MFKSKLCRHHHNTFKTAIFEGLVALQTTRIKRVSGLLVFFLFVFFPLSNACGELHKNIAILSFLFFKFTFFNNYITPLLQEFL